MPVLILKKMVETAALQRTNAENFKQIFPEKEFPHSCVGGQIIYSHEGSANTAAGNMWTNPGNI
jgi:hypothetical protein